MSVINVRLGFKQPDGSRAGMLDFPCRPKLYVPPGVKGLHCGQQWLLQ